MEMSSTSRRTFLKSTLTGTAVLASAPSFGVQGANERIGIACIGIRGKGRSHIKHYLALKKKGVELVALCDVDDKVLQQRADEVEEWTGKRPKTYRDIRLLLEDKDVNAISIATPNHWHALMTIWGCQAGKDVYVEKPACWSIDEGRKMVDAARKYNRIVQVGTQARSFPHILERIEEMKQGLIGDIYMARGLCFKRRDSLGFKPVSTPPEHLDYNLWLGPAPEQPFHKNLVHYNWHWFWDFGCGDLGNQGVHEVDLARVVMGEADVLRVHSTGGRFGYEDQGETPNTQTSTFTYPDGRQLVFEVRGRYTHAEEGVQIGNLYYGSEGYIAGGNWATSHGYPAQDQSIADWQPKYGYGGTPYGKGGDTPAAPATAPKLDEDYRYHFENFIAAIRSRNHEDLNADILEGHRSAMLVHMANISYRLGMPLTFDTRKEVFIGEGSRKANKFLVRDYREPFVVPRKV